jgi:hypothetical protein
LLPGINCAAGKTPQFGANNKATRAGTAQAAIKIFLTFRKKNSRAFQLRFLEAHAATG